MRRSRRRPVTERPAQRERVTAGLQELAEERQACVTRIAEIDSMLRDVASLVNRLVPATAVRPSQELAPRENSLIRLCACGCGEPAAKRKGKGGGRLPKYAVGHPALLASSLKLDDEIEGLEVVRSGRNAVCSSEYLGSSLSGRT